MAQVFDATSGNSVANSYVTVAEADQYIENRYGSTSTWTTWSALTTAQKQEKLIFGCDYIEQRYSNRWNTGYRQTSTQRLSWPRYDAYYMEGMYFELIAGIPQEVKEANIECAIELISNESDLLPSYDRRTKKEKVGNLEVTYADNSNDTKSFPKVTGRLRRLISTGLRVARG